MNSSLSDFYVNLAADEKQNTTISAVISLFFKTMGHLPQDFLIEHGFHGAKLLFFQRWARTEHLYLHFDREAMKYNPLSIIFGRCYLCLLSSFREISLVMCPCFDFRDLKKKSYPVFPLTPRHVHSHQMFFSMTSVQLTFT